MIKESSRIYDYIREDLKSEQASKNLMRQVEQRIQLLQYTPQLYAKTEKTDELKMVYRKIVIKNYVILYTIDEDKRIVYISHMYYGKTRFLNF